MTVYYYENNYDPHNDSIVVLADIGDEEDVFDNNF